jgi:flagellar biosynthesis protein FliR
LHIGAIDAAMQVFFVGLPLSILIGLLFLLLLLGAMSFFSTMRAALHAPPHGKSPGQ